MEIIITVAMDERTYFILLNRNKPFKHAFYEEITAIADNPEAKRYVNLYDGRPIVGDIPALTYRYDQVLGMAINSIMVLGTGDVSVAAHGGTGQISTYHEIDDQDKPAADCTIFIYATVTVPSSYLSEAHPHNSRTMK